MFKNMEREINCKNWVVITQPNPYKICGAIVIYVKSLRSVKHSRDASLYPLVCDVYFPYLNLTAKVLKIFYINGTMTFLLVQCIG